LKYLVTGLQARIENQYLLGQRKQLRADKRVLKSEVRDLKQKLGIAVPPEEEEEDSDEEDEEEEEGEEDDDDDEEDDSSDSDEDEKGDAY